MIEWCRLEASPSHGPCEERSLGASMKTSPGWGMSSVVRPQTVAGSDPGPETLGDFEHFRFAARAADVIGEGSKGSADVAGARDR